VLPTVAIRLARCIRPLWVLVLVAVLAALTQPSATAKPGGHDRPRTIVGLQKRLGRLALRNTELVERFNQARVLVRHRQHQAQAAEHVADLARAQLHRATVSFTAMIQAQYEFGPFGAAGALLSSRSGGNAVVRLNTLDLLSDHAADVVARVDSARRVAAEKSRAAQEALASATEQRDAVAKRRAFITREVEKYKRLLGLLTLRQRAEYVHRADPAVSAARVRNLPRGPSAAARKAVNFALEQVGKPYIFGAAGPGAYDCSGLTMAAWASARVHLPHSAEDQYNHGRHVRESHLEPGDLLFFYRPIEHVTIYVGDGLMVSAPTVGQNVQVVPLAKFQSDYSGATRLN
jgi:cell wall-associated NlpC family hydrolase